MTGKPRFPEGHGRRVLLWAALVYALVQLGTDVAVDGWWRQGRSTYLQGLFDRIRAERNPVHVLCLGTSRLGLAFSAAEVQARLRQATAETSLHVFNASIAAQDYPTANAILSEVLKRGKCPSLVVIEVAPELVARYNLWLGNHVMPHPTWRHLGVYVGDLVRDLVHVPDLVKDRLIPLYRCRQQIRTGVCTSVLDTVTPPPAATSDGPPCATEGNERFLDRDPDVVFPDRVELGLRTLRDWLRNYQVGGLAALNLEQLVRRCRERGMTVVLVAPPVSAVQRRLYAGPIDTAFTGYIQRLARAYHCTYVDYRACLPDGLFVDNHHVMTPQGAVRFSRRLTREVLVPAWPGRVPAASRQDP